MKLLTLLLSIVLLTGCSAAPPEEQIPVTIERVASPADAATWIRGLEPTMSTSELASDVRALGDLVVSFDLPALVNNSIGGELITLNADLIAGDVSVPDAVARLQVVASELEENG